MIPTGAILASSEIDKKDDEVLLNRETVIALALKNYVAVMQNQLQSKAQAAQLIYLLAQRSKAAAPIPTMAEGRLPDSMDELIELIPNYEQLTEEEKGQLDSALAVQIMINSSLNQLINNQSVKQYDGLLKQQQQTIDSFDDQIRIAANGIYANTIEEEKVKLMVQFYALQSYYELLLIQNDFRASQLEEQYFAQKLKDARQLYQAGLVPLSQVEEAEQSYKKQQGVVRGLEQQYEFRVQIMKLDLGIQPNQFIKWGDDSSFRISENVKSMNVELEKQFNIKILDVAINQAQSEYERILINDKELANFYLITVGIEKDKKAAKIRELEKSLLELDEEGEQWAERIESLEKEKSNLLEQLERYKTMFQYGQLPVRDMEDLEFQISKLGNSIYTAELRFEIWKEKKWAAIQGLMI